MAMTISPLHALTLAELRQRTSIKWRTYDPDVLPLWVAEMDVTLAEPIADALRAAIASGDTGYPFGGDYAEAIADFAAGRWGWRPDLALASPVADVMVGIVEVIRILTDPGDLVVLTPPVYPPFTAFTEHAGRRIATAPLDPAGRLDMDTIDAALAAATAEAPHVVLLLCNPHNPTGTLHTRDELISVAGIASRHGVRIVIDEIHAPLTMPGEAFVPFLSLPGAERAFSLMSASKAWNLAGIKSAVLFGGADTADDFARFPPEMRYGPSHLGNISHTAAYRYGRPWLDGLLADLDGQRHLLRGLLAQHLPSVRYQMPAATYLTWLDCRDLGLGDDPAALFLEQGRVAVNSGIPFGIGGEGHVRMNIATSPEILTEAVRRMASVL